LKACLLDVVERLSENWAEVAFTVGTASEHKHGAPERRREDELADLAQRHRGYILGEHHPTHDRLWHSPTLFRAASIPAVPTLPDKKGMRLPGSAVIAVEPAGVELETRRWDLNGIAI
jgi:hypothetical protein